MLRICKVLGSIFSTNKYCFKHTTSNIYKREDNTKLPYTKYLGYKVSKWPIFVFIYINFHFSYALDYFKAHMELSKNLEGSHLIKKLLLVISSTLAGKQLLCQKALKWLLRTTPVHPPLGYLPRSKPA